VLDTWQGKPQNVRTAQQAFLFRARLNSAASRGLYTPEMERVA
jgi:fructose-bisphosphate aldolase, class I